MSLSINENMNYYRTTLQLEQHSVHPNNFLKEVFRDKEIDLDPHVYEGGKRSISTCVYYMLTQDGIMRFHKVKSNKYWQFVDGCVLKTYILDEPSQCIKTYYLGNISLHGQAVADKPIQQQLIIHPNQWVAAEPLEQNSFSLITCTISPGFDMRDYIEGKRGELAKLAPNDVELITRFTS